MLLTELVRTKAIGSKYIVLHPGYATTCDRPTAIKNIALAINELNVKCPDVVICLETMAGKGSEIGKDFDEIAQIISQVKNKSLVGVCLDTCHINDSGLDVSK
ncbi:MAG: TIM barrel protein, partial [Mycoplasmoidaceae bacterium]|nr:TIM barrel protein [Mycoplasmoidaceae bacterium]